MNLVIATNTVQALQEAEQAITKLFKLQDGVIEALEQAADVLQKMAQKAEAQYGEVHPHLKNLRNATLNIDKGIDKAIDAAVARHIAKEAAAKEGAA